MTLIKAKPIIENKFWIVEEDGNRVGTLRKNEENHFVFSNENGVKMFPTEKHITDQFGKDFFIAKIVKEADNSLPNEVQGYGTSTKPHNAMYDIQKKLPLFTKSKDSKSLYCAGYYVIRFDKGWVKSFCPKLITLQRYDYKGPFKTDLEMKQVLSNVNK
tara:strand:+ start:1723 stop:2199 length:477 start_codon:yes stop_codon:yes gene_type:complete